MNHIHPIISSHSLPRWVRYWSYTLLISLSVISLTPARAQLPETPAFKRVQGDNSATQEYSLHMHRGYIFLKVSLNDSAPVFFLFNPGTMQTLVDETHAEVFLNNALPGEAKPVYLLDQAKPAKRYQFHSIQIKDTQWRAPVIHVIDLQSLTRYMRFQVAGVIGRDLFVNKHLTLDLHSRILKVSDKQIETANRELDRLNVSTHENGYLFVRSLAHPNFHGILDFSRMGTLTFLSPQPPYNAQQGIISAYAEYDPRPMRLLDPQDPQLQNLLTTTSLHFNEPQDILPRYIQDADTQPRTYIGLRYFQGARIHMDGNGTYLMLEHPAAITRFENEPFMDSLKRGPFHMAVIQRRFADLPAFLRLGISLNLRDTEGKTALHLAALYQDRKAIRFLLKHKAQTNIRDNQGRTALWYAATGDLTIIQELLAAGSPVNTADNAGITPLMRAAGANLKHLNLLIKAGANTKQKDQAGRSALVHAMRHNAEANAIFFMDNINPDDYKKGVSPLLAAAELGHTDWVKSLQRRGFDLSIIDNNTGYNLLHLAAVRGKRDLIFFLIDRDISTTQRSGLKNITPALVAILNGNDEACLAILNTQETIDIPPIDNITSLAIAASKNMTGTVTKLISAGYRVNQPSGVGVYPLHLAASAGHLNMVKLLGSAGAWIDAMDGTRKTPLMYALSKGHLDVAKVLLELGAGASNMDQQDNTPMHYLLDHGDHPHLVHKLLELGADSQQLSKLGWTPIMQAARNERKQSLQVLLDHAQEHNILINHAELWPVAIEGFHHPIYPMLKADKTSLDEHYQYLDDHVSPIHHAAAIGNENALDALVDMGYTINMDDPKSDTPLASAIRSRRYQMIQLLLRMNANREHAAVIKAIEECKDTAILQLLKPNESE